jgi:hypothetical protein
MTTRSIAAALVVSVLAAIPAAIPAWGQTATELLQKGIYAQETEGNLDNAILIYRQIVNSAPSHRDIAAQAQYRLAQALLQKGDLATASAEFAKLSRDYSDYRNLISSLAGQIQPRGGGRGGAGTLNDDQRARLAEIQLKLTAIQAKERQIQAGVPGAGNQQDFEALVAEALELRRQASSGGYGPLGNLVLFSANECSGPGPRSPALEQACTAATPAMREELLAKLAELRTKYSEGHPDIVALKAQIEDLTRALNSAAGPAIGQRRVPPLEAPLVASLSTPVFWHADLGKPVTIQGKVSRVQWTNPRVIADVPVTGPDGTAVLWEFQFGAPSTLLKLGFTRNTLVPGDTVTFVGYLAKEDTGQASLKYVVPASITLPDGRTLSAGSPQE